MAALQAKKMIAQRQRRGWLFGQWAPEGNEGYGETTESSYQSPVLNAELAYACCTCHQVMNRIMPFL